MKKTKWDVIWDILSYEMKKEVSVHNKFSYSHYTSLEVLFNILEGDSIWASNVRFSNDAMEERMLKLDNLHMRDDYIVCFCSEGDALSQWRGYCPQGGAAIKLRLNGIQKYSILHADFDKTHKYEVYENTPLPVLYIMSSIKTESQSEMKKAEIIRTIELKEKETGIKVALDDVLPYIKNGMFYEEKELRLAFANVKGNLSECVRFRTLTNGVKVPYIVIKSGDVGQMWHKCSTKLNNYTDDELLELIDDRGDIWIPEGSDQEKQYYKLFERIQQLKKERSQKGNISIFCSGHLPIEEIIVAPTYDRERIAEQIERFCKSKYWLSNVEVKISDIPYIGPNN